MGRQWLVKPVKRAWSWSPGNGPRGRAGACDFTDFTDGTNQREAEWTSKRDQMNRGKNEWTNEKNQWARKLPNYWACHWTNLQSNERRLNEWIHEWMNKTPNEYMTIWTSKWTNDNPRYFRNEVPTYLTSVIKLLENQACASKHPRYRIIKPVSQPSFEFWVRLQMVSLRPLLRVQLSNSLNRWAS